VVLRLGRNAVDLGADATTEQLVAAITGADDNVVAARAARGGKQPAGPSLTKEIEP
jgi:D-xylose transport system ATP-binding protein